MGANTASVGGEGHTARPSVARQLRTYFFYGTLMDAAVRAAVLGPRTDLPPVEAASLSGYGRLYMRGATYPVLVPAPQQEVEGVLLHEVDANAERRLVRFEGDAYWQAMVTVAGRRSGSIAACCFLPVNNNLADETRPWDLATWRRRHRRRYLTRIRSNPVAAG
ncbi:gamma-glutamylcyclotransferase family protein [Defluviicoccus vanus]|uniref:Putative gamma-glutamylcyclotransferase n=1 Tax=Defluviicoccus vanus TaxID=111831 RepID=A0A7H1MXN6_9PROT|nr:gamma-glutamylcyclotransferase family protein [Defluviicoccus vanus]QNT68222.1 gamma-glutamylcyclotransferase [Defluviicoccus vanus]